MQPSVAGPVEWNRSRVDGRKADLEIIIESQDMRNVIELAKKAAAGDVTVLLEGETGVGKEVLARHIHTISERSTGPFVPVNCGAIPEALFAAEFFGYERGAFTTAFVTHKGYFEEANRGTLLLDEICEIPLFMQVKLLRALEDDYVIRLGGEKKIPIDVRVIATSSRSVWPLVCEGRFRKDLFYRLAAWCINVPPLRKRKDEIKALAEYFLRRNGVSGRVLTAEALAKLRCHDWPGNVRELGSCIKRAILLSDGKDFIGVGDIRMNGCEGFSEEAESRSLKDALEASGGCVVAAARLLRVHRNTLYNRSRKFGIKIDHFRCRRKPVHGGIK